MKYQGLVVVALLVVLAASALAVFSLSGNREQGGGPGPSSGLSPEFFQVDRVYFDDWVDYMGQVSPYDFAVVVEITSGGRGVKAWSVGLDYGDGIGFEDNVMETSLGQPRPREPQAGAEGGHGQVDAARWNPPEEGEPVPREGSPDPDGQLLRGMGRGHGIPEPDVSYPPLKGVGFPARMC